MKHSSKAVELIKPFEGLRLEAYLDGNGVPTIGYGHTSGVKLGDTCTEEQADQWLDEDISYSDAIVSSHVTVPLNQNQFDALTSIVFNVGPGKKGVRDGIVTLKSGEPSTLLRRLNNSDYDGVSAAFLSWNKVNGQPSNGLIRRREAERALFLS